MYDLYFNMKYKKYFQDLLLNDHMECSKKGKIRTTNWEKVLVADEYVGITRITYEETNQKGTILSVDYESFSGKIREQFEAIVSYNGKVHFNFREIGEIIKDTIKSPYRPQMFKIYRNYFTYCIEAERKRNLGLTAKCGWFREGNSLFFLPISLPEYYHIKNFKMFDRLSPMDDLNKKNIEDYCKITNNFEMLFSFLTANKSALVMFTYCIHAILWDYINGYRKFEHTQITNTDTAIFSLCVYGENIQLAKTASNVLLNLFDLPKGSWGVISRKIHISATSLRDSKFYSLESYKGVPLIVTSKKNQFTKNSGIIKKFQKMRVDGRFHMFPVFISQSSVNADELINCCTDDISLDTKDDKVLFQMHRQLCIILTYFVKYLSEISNPDIYHDRTDYNYMNLRITQGLNEYQVSDEWLDDHLPEYLLFISLDCFCRYLDKTPLQTYSEIILQNLVEWVNEEDLQPEEQSNPQIDYLEYFALFLSEAISNTDNFSWIYTDKERDDECDYIYLHNKTGLDQFNVFLESKKIPYIKSREFTKLLKENNLIKVPKAGTSNTFKRKGEYVFIIKKDLLKQ